MTESTPHIGRKISKVRELKGIKQEALAALLGISQQAISKIEQSPEVEDLALDKIARALGVTSEAIKNFTEEAVFNYFNNFHDNSTGDFRHHCTFNPLDKLMELVEENKKLYERLLQAEKEKNELLSKK
ncbi:helix-turn-helix domain-containing protein [Mucilaginibacter kameinonensis]|uniref:helix-turn-helix domain-containing protein n=1 Tax=Mucilaginibacter kameinonensis TaxID=452286 RepID=UPI000EF76F4B|nr:helix-turn-helix transcriptional regulator [Mucilaginibacter kameinonensis]